MRLICWLRGLWDSVRIGVIFDGDWIIGHRYVEQPDSKWQGEHLVCTVCGDDWRSKP